jgi:predicted MarR family transcription regulator
MKKTTEVPQHSDNDGTQRKVGPIVSSAHLASGQSQELSELEFGLIVAGNAFNRWMVRCMNAAGLPELSPLDILVLHSVNHRNRAKKNGRYLSCIERGRQPYRYLRAQKAAKAKGCHV